ncbi:MAG: PfkB family carbohydrate kinase [Tannerella sp.]|jgi:sugar/nucleoside kinase (ribokinase family)|nr:PfkB family carbohydrate kinase [Tannerella sp.]
MKEICCVGHITLDKVTTPKNTVFMPGGTAFYFSHAVRHFDDLDYLLVTAVGAPERIVTEALEAQGLDVIVIESPASVFFENIYGADSNERKQRVWAKAASFRAEDMLSVESKIFHLGALLADDFSLDVVRNLAGKGLVSVDSQGYLREVRDTRVHAIDWQDKLEALRYVHFLKANEYEMEVLTGYKDARQAALRLHEWGVHEVILTFGSEGSLIYDGSQFYDIPAYPPSETIDATGCGDTYMAGYLYRRVKGASIVEAAHFAAALSTLKIQRSGPVDASVADVLEIIRH